MTNKKTLFSLLFCGYFTSHVCANPLHQAIANNHLANLQELLSCPADNLEEPNNDKQTPLLHAIAKHMEHNMLPLISALLERGVNLEACDQYGQTPLLLAYRLQHQDIVFNLIRAGANINAADHNGITLLMSAAYNNHKDFISFLIDSGVDECQKDNAGKTANDYLERGQERWYKESFYLDPSLEIRATKS